MKLSRLQITYESGIVGVVLIKLALVAADEAKVVVLLHVVVVLRVGKHPLAAERALAMAAERAVVRVALAAVAVKLRLRVQLVLVEKVLAIVNANVAASASDQQWNHTKKRTIETHHKLSFGCSFLICWLSSSFLLHEVPQSGQLNCSKCSTSRSSSGVSQKICSFRCSCIVPSRIKLNGVDGSDVNIALGASSLQ